MPSGIPQLITGIGKVAAAASVASWLAGHEDHPADFELVNIGTAGALRDGYEGLHLPSAVINHDMSTEVLQEMGFAVTDELTIEGGDDGTVLATGDTFVADAAHRDLLAVRAALVDMEGFAVAWAARAAGVGIRLVKHVSDNADSSALSWPEVVDASARVLGDWLADYLA